VTKKEDTINKGGRPFSVVADAETLKTILGLGKIQATSKECAAVLGISEPTWINFKRNNPEVAEAYTNGTGHGQVSLRRRQYRAAMRGNTTMMIWLGKQYLDQKDKKDIARTEAVSAQDARKKLMDIIERYQKHPELDA